MPNELLSPKGRYQINRRLRRLEQRQEAWLHRQNIRTYNPEQRYTAWRLFKLIGYLLLFNVCFATFTSLYFFSLFKIRVPEHYPAQRKGTALSSVPGHVVGNVKLIRYKENQDLEIAPFINQIDKFIEKYGYDGALHLRGCNLDDYWGYSSGVPCILLKLNNAIQFEAVTYGNSITLPKEVPNELYDHILQLSVEQRYNRIWAACNFMNNLADASIEYIPFRYYHSDGLFSPHNVFLHSVSENLTEEEKSENPAYRRVIGVQFHNLPLNHDIYVECTVWAKNIPLENASTMFLIHVEGVEIPPETEDDD